MSLQILSSPLYSELFLYFTEFLGPKDVGRLSLVCKDFHVALANRCQECAFQVLEGVPALARRPGLEVKRDIVNLSAIEKLPAYAERNSDLQPAGPKNGGCAPGCVYEYGLKKYMGKIGRDKEFFTGNIYSTRTRTKLGVNSSTIEELVAAQFYLVCGQGSFIVPSSFLSCQPLDDPHTLSIHLFNQQVGRLQNAGMHKCLRIMTEFIPGYEDFSKAQTQLDNLTYSFIDFLKHFHRPPETLLTPDGRTVPLLGIMELVATARILADTDWLGGRGDNAGWVWEYDKAGKIIAGRTVKIDPGEAFGFGLLVERHEIVRSINEECYNRVLYSYKQMGPPNWWMDNLKDIQVANQEAASRSPPTIFWTSLNEEQKRAFLDHTHILIQQFLNEDLSLFFGNKALDRGPNKQLPEDIVKYLSIGMRKWVELQKEIYEKELTLKKVHFEYPLPLLFFVGREEMLGLLKQKLVTPTFEATNFAVISAEGGMGKSELAAYFTYQSRSAFSFIYWLTCDSPTALLNSYLGLAEALNLVLKEKENISTVRKSVYRALESRDKPYLLIFDNVEEDLELPKKGGSCLLTTRSAELLKTHNLPLTPLSLEESLDYLQQETGEPFSEEMEGLAQSIEGRPLTLSLVAATMKQEHLTAKEYLLKWNLSIEKHADPLVAAWHLIFVCIQEKEPLALDWLMICSLFRPDAIPLDWLKSWQKEKALPILRLLNDYALIQFDYQKEEISLHRLLQETLLAFAEEKQKMMQEAIQILKSQKLDSTCVETWGKGKIWLLHAESCFAHDLATTSSETAPVLRNMANFSSTFGRFREALTYSEKALEICRKLYPGQDHPELARSLANMGVYLSELGKFGEALKYDKWAMEMFKKLYPGEDHPDLACSLLLMGCRLSHLGKFGEALKYAKQALEMYNKLYPGQDHPDLAHTLTNMGVYLSKVGKIKKAFKYDKKGLEMYQKLYSGQDHPNLALSLLNIGCGLSKLGKIKKAFKYDKKALEMYNKLYPGQDHPYLARALVNTGVRLSQLGKIKKAFKYDKKALEMYKKLYPGQDHPNLALSLLNIGYSLSQLGNFSEALKYTKQALEMYKKLYPGQDHPDLARSLANMGVYLSELGNFSEALKYTKQALEMKRALFSNENHPEIIKLKNRVRILEAKLKGMPMQEAKNKQVKLKKGNTSCLIQ